MLVTDKQMKLELINRITAKLIDIRNDLTALDAVDRLNDYDLHDQLVTTSRSLNDLDLTIQRMYNITSAT